MTTPRSTQRSQTESMVAASPEWKPHATLALVTTSTNPASSVGTPSSTSPRSALRSMLTHATWVRRLHPVRRGDPEQAQAVGKDDPRRLDQPEPGAMYVGRLLVTTRQHPASVVEPVVVPGELLEVARHPMHLTHLRGRRHDPRELPERTQQHSLAVM